MDDTMRAALLSVSRADVPARSEKADNWFHALFEAYKEWKRQELDDATWSWRDFCENNLKPAAAEYGLERVVEDFQKTLEDSQSPENLRDAFDEIFKDDRYEDAVQAYNGLVEEEARATQQEEFNAEDLESWVPQTARDQIGAGWQKAVENTLDEGYPDWRRAQETTLVELFSTDWMAHFKSAAAAEQHAHATQQDEFNAESLESWVPDPPSHLDRVTWDAAVRKTLERSYEGWREAPRETLIGLFDDKGWMAHFESAAASHAAPEQQAAPAAVSWEAVQALLEEKKIDFPAIAVDGPPEAIELVNEKYQYLLQETETGRTELARNPANAAQLKQIMVDIVAGKLKGELVAE